MTDVFSPAKRSAVMARVRGVDTKPERRVRAILTALGYRYRLQGKDLPGKPDLVFRGRKKVIFVHGCFWHGCEREGCRGARRPKSNTGYWAEKLARNKARDIRNLDALAALGWEALVIWECDLSDDEAVKTALIQFLRPPSAKPNAASAKPSR